MDGINQQQPSRFLQREIRDLAAERIRGHASTEPSEGDRIVLAYFADEIRDLSANFSSAKPGLYLATERGDLFGLTEERMPSMITGAAVIRGADLFALNQAEYDKALAFYNNAAARSRAPIPTQKEIERHALDSVARKNEKLVESLESVRFETSAGSTRWEIESIEGEIWIHLLVEQPDGGDLDRSIDLNRAEVTEHLDDESVVRAITPAEIALVKSGAAEILKLGKMVCSKRRE